MVLVIRSLLFIVLLFIAEFYFYKKLLRSIRSVFRINKLKRIYVIILLVVLNIYPLYILAAWNYAGITNKPVFIPQNSVFDYLVLYPFWIMILIDIQCSLLFLIIDAFKIFLFPFYKKVKIKVLNLEGKIIFIVVVAFIIYVPARVAHDYNTIQVRAVNFVKNDLPDNLNGFKLVFISDIHADRYTDGARLQKFINDVNAVNPDLVLVGGDMISSTPDYIDTAAKYMGKIRSKYGVFSCVGDHDNWAYRRDYRKSLNDVEKALKDFNVEMINNGNKVLNINGTSIQITFITDTYIEKISSPLLNSLTSDTSKYGLKILLVHQPGQNVVSRAVKTGYDLFLAGHTHGGQITFLFPFINLTPTLLETKYIRGNFRFGKMLVIVTRGLGMSLVPIRYNSTPEVTVINILRY